jgi:hypothetical protein
MIFSLNGHKTHLAMPGGPIRKTVELQLARE